MSAFAAAERGPGFSAASSTARSCTVTWSVVPTKAVEAAEFNAVAADTPDDAWAVGGPGFVNHNRVAAHALTSHWDGSRWRRVPNPLTAAALEGVAAIARNDAWTVGEQEPQGRPVGLYGDGAVAAHWDGSRWRRVTLPGLGRLSGVAATSTRDVWAVGVGSRGSGIAVRWDGKRWHVSLRLRQTELRDVVALSPDDVWVAGDRRLASPQTFIEAHWDGRRWRTYSQLPPRDGKDGLDEDPRLVAIAAVATDDVWAAGDAGQAGGPAWPDTVLFHWDGKRWQKALTPQFMWVNDLATRAPGDLWLATITGNGDAFGVPTLERRLGTRWSRPGSWASSQEVAALTSDQAQGLWAVGDVGSAFNGLGFPQRERPLIAHGRCS